LGPENQGQGELKKAELVEKRLTELGLEITRYDAPDPRVECGFRPNLTACLQGGDGPVIWVLSHLDVVPTGPLDLWESDPWQVRVDGDKLYGRGVLDDQAGIVSSYFGLKTLIDLGVKPAGKVGLVMVSDEETGSEYGLGHLLENHPEIFSPNDLIVVPDFGDAKGSLIEISEKSILWLKVDVYGSQIHASTPEKGKNALYASARMIRATYEVRDMFPQKDPLFTPPGSTMEPTKKEAGVPNVNTVPGQDTFYIDCRILPEIKIDDVEKAFTDKFNAIAAEEGVRVQVKRVQGYQSPPKTDANAPVVLALAKAIKAVTGLEAKAGGIGGGSVAALFREKGLPAAVWATFQETAHTPNEFCLMSNLVQDAKIFALLFAGATG
jgi:succinyl-diaminopimelate desuccinylase